MKKGLLDDWAFGHVIVTSLTFEADYAFLGLGYVNLSGELYPAFLFVCSIKINFSRTQRYILFGPIS